MIDETLLADRIQWSEAARDWTGNRGRSSVLRNAIIMELGLEPEEVEVADRLRLLPDPDPDPRQGDLF